MLETSFQRRAGSGALVRKTQSRRAIYRANVSIFHAIHADTATPNATAALRGRDPARRANNNTNTGVSVNNILPGNGHSASVNRWFNVHSLIRTIAVNPIMNQSRSSLLPRGRARPRTDAARPPIRIRAIRGDVKSTPRYGPKSPSLKCMT